MASCRGYGQAERPGSPMCSPSPKMDRGGTQISIYGAFYWKAVPIFKMFDGSKTGANVFNSGVGDASQKRNLQ